MTALADVHELESSCPTFGELAALEPRLDKLREEARRVKPSGPKFCANAVWCDHFKPRLYWLVGWALDDPSQPALRTSEAYYLAYRTVYEELPPCGVCACF